MCHSFFIVLMYYFKNIYLNKILSLYFMESNFFFLFMFQLLINCKLSINCLVSLFKQFSADSRCKIKVFMLFHLFIDIKLLIIDFSKQSSSFKVLANHIGILSFIFLSALSTLHISSNFLLQMFVSNI